MFNPDFSENEKGLQTKKSVLLSGGPNRKFFVGLIILSVVGAVWYFGSDKESTVSETPPSLKISSASFRGSIENVYYAFGGDHDQRFEEIKETFQNSNKEPVSLRKNTNYVYLDNEAFLTVHQILNCVNKDAGRLLFIQYKNNQWNVYPRGPFGNQTVTVGNIDEYKVFPGEGFMLVSQNLAPAYCFKKANSIANSRIENLQEGWNLIAVNENSINRFLNNYQGVISVWYLNDIESATPFAQFYGDDLELRNYLLWVKAEAVRERGDDYDGYRGGVPGDDYDGYQGGDNVPADGVRGDDYDGYRGGVPGDDYDGYQGGDNVPADGVRGDDAPADGQDDNVPQGDDPPVDVRNDAINNVPEIERFRSAYLQSLCTSNENNLLHEDGSLSQEAVEVFKTNLLAEGFDIDDVDTPEEMHVFLENYISSHPDFLSEETVNEILRCVPQAEIDEEDEGEAVDVNNNGGSWRDLRDSLRNEEDNGEDGDRNGDDNGND